MELQPRSITKEALLLVEGKDPLHFFGALCNHLSLSQQLEIINFGGVGELRSFLIGLRGQSGFRNVKRIGIIRDAEGNAAGAFQSVQASLQHVQLTVPKEPEQLSCDGGQLAVGVLILPGQGEPGMLETLLCKTFTDRPECRCIDAFFRCVQEQCPAANIRKPDKARARAFLATKPDSYPSVGIGARKGYWPLDHEVLEPVRTFLKSVAATAH